MLIDNINLNHIRIFESVYRNKSMTKAALELHMTQSGVSQHVKHLESILDVRLFDRIKQRLIPTKTADMFFVKSSNGLYEIENSITSIKSNSMQYSGTIKICTLSDYEQGPVLSLLANYSKLHTNVNFILGPCSHNKIRKKLYIGEFDFCLSDESILSHEFKRISFFIDQLSLYCTSEYINSKVGPKGNIIQDKHFFEKLEYIDYIDQKGDLETYLKLNYNIPKIKLSRKAYLSNINSVYELINKDLGVGLLPKSYVGEDSQLYCFQNQNSLLSKTIYISYLKSRSLGPLHKNFINYLENEIKIRSLQNLQD